MENFPINQFLIGDDAHTCSETLLTPFSGNEKSESDKSCFNFHLSQLRIRVEMAFGILCSKWTMFKRPLRTKLSNSAATFMCAVKLHNFCINEGEKVTIDPSNQEELLDGFLPSEPVILNRVAGGSMTRTKLVQEMAELGMTRPQSNIDRNRDN